MLCSNLEGFPSGQRDQTVNLTAQPSEVRILPPPFTLFIQGLGASSASCSAGQIFARERV